MIGTRDSTAASGGGQRQRQAGQLFLARISAKTEEIHTVWCDGVACLNGCIAWCRLRRKISSALKIKIEQLHSLSLFPRWCAVQVQQLGKIGFADERGRRLDRFETFFPAQG